MIDLASATAERDITVSSTGGEATLGAAELTGTGAGHDLSVSAAGTTRFWAGPTIRASPRPTSSAGRAATRARRRSARRRGDAKVYLDTSAAIDTLEGAGRRHHRQYSGR
jgi:hypothetical protein